MKKLFALTLALILSLGCLGAFAQEERRVITVGMLTNLGEAQEVYNSLSNDHMLLHEPLKDYILDYTYYDSLTSLLLALYAGDVTCARVNELVGKYLVSQDENLQIVDFGGTRGVAVVEGMMHAYSLMVREQDTQLHAQLNSAIQTLKENGTLDELVQTYLLDFLDGEGQPEVIEMPSFTSDRVIRVAVTGDLPPMDYVGADGTPAGFNVALLSEIANLLQVNIELMQVESGARSVALATERADVAFWVESDTCPIHPEFGSGFDLPAGMIETDYYLTTTPVVVMPK